MANELGAAAVHPIQVWVEASMICFSEEPAPAGRLEVRVACFARRSFEYWRRGDAEPQDKQVQQHAAGGTTTAFAIANIAALRSADTCRGTLSGMLALLPQLQELRLTEDELDAVVPGVVVPVLVNAARRGDGFTFSFTMTVQLRVIHDERALLMACKVWLASTASGERDCAICVDELEQEPALVLPGCTHAFHCRCVYNWFPTAATCPTCRDNVWLSALPVFIEWNELE